MAAALWEDAYTAITIELVKDLIINLCLVHLGRHLELGPLVVRYGSASGTRILIGELLYSNVAGEGLLESQFFPANDFQYFGTRRHVLDRREHYQTTRLETLCREIRAHPLDQGWIVARIGQVYSSDGFRRAVQGATDADGTDGSCHCTDKLSLHTLLGNQKGQPSACVLPDDAHEYERIDELVGMRRANKDDGS